MRRRLDGRRKTGACTPAQVFSYSVSYSCGHCENPRLRGGVPHRRPPQDEETGIVSITADDCIGCQSCVKACPYGAPQFVEADDHREVRHVRRAAATASRPAWPSARSAP